MPSEVFAYLHAPEVDDEVLLSVRLSHFGMASGIEDGMRFQAREGVTGTYIDVSFSGQGTIKDISAMTREFRRWAFRPS